MYEYENDKIAAADIAVTEAIREGFAKFFAGDSKATVPLFVYGEMREIDEPVADAISDAIGYGEPCEIMAKVLQGADVSALRSALVADYIKRNADVIAFERVMREVPDFMTREAA